MKINKKSYFSFKHLLMTCCAPFYCLGLLLAAQATQAQILQIMPLGDSITKGGGVGNDNTTTIGGTNYYINTGYRGQLYSDLASHTNLQFSFQGQTSFHYNYPLLQASQTNTYGGSYTNGNGFGSYKLSDIYANLAGSSQPSGADPNFGGYWITGATNSTITNAAVFPNIVLLMGGVNDFQGNLLVGQVETNMNNILTWFSSNRPTAKLLVANIIPKVNGTSGNYPTATAYTNAIISYNTWLQNTELPQFTNYNYVNMFTTFSTNYLTYTNIASNPTTSYYSTDGVHPNTNGYNAMGDIWSTAVLKVVPEPSEWALIGLSALTLIGLSWKIARRG